jgi:hypothetical protein
MKKKIDEWTYEAMKITTRDHQAKLQELKNAPEFRDYIRYLLDNIDKTQEELDSEKKKEYNRRHNAKKPKK